MALAAGALMLLSTSATAAPEAHAAPARAAVATTQAVSLLEQKATVAYWTPQRRAAAKPADILTLKGAPGARQTKPFSVGKQGRVKGGAPAAKLTPRLTASRYAMSYPYPYSSGDVAAANYTKYPYRLNGVIFFTNNGSGYACSGTSVASYHGTKEEDEVWTAGHCVANTDQSSGLWDSKAEFIPAYNGTVKDYDPYGIFVATRYSTTNGWKSNGDVSVDEGAMEVGTNANGQTLGQAVGWDGFAWNYSSTEAFTAFGYPAASPYTGNLMIVDTATTASSYDWPGGAGQPLIGIGNPMTAGSSGGAWDIDWTSTSGGYINGHNDYKFYSQPDAVYSPYQDTLANTVRCFGASSC
jgi:hypothetical protein